MTSAAADAERRPLLPALPLTALDLLGESYEQHCHACAFSDPPVGALSFEAWLLAWLRRELADLGGRLAALEAEWQVTMRGDGR